MFVCVCVCVCVCMYVCVFVLARCSMKSVVWVERLRAISKNTMIRCQYRVSFVQAIAVAQCETKREEDWQTRGGRQLNTVRDAKHAYGICTMITARAQSCEPYGACNCTWRWIGTHLEWGNRRNLLPDSDP